MWEAPTELDSIPWATDAEIPGWSALGERQKEQRKRKITLDYSPPHTYTLSSLLTSRSSKPRPAFYLSPPVIIIDISPSKSLDSIIVLPLCSVCLFPQVLDLGAYFRLKKGEKDGTVRIQGGGELGTPPLFLGWKERERGCLLDIISLPS